jgi:multiple sugar transport system ATP-binding protein
MAEITLENLSKIYGDGTKAVRELNLEIADGELMVLVGPSGCGKTTALRMVAGLEEISSGSVRIGERVVNQLPPKDRDLAMVFQNYALYPHMSAFDNMAFGLKMRRLPKAEIKRRVDDAARVLGLDQVLKKKPRTLSGGQRQRVAMGRAIVREPQAFLMDEPLSNLDAKLRVEMRAEIARIQRDLQATTIYVTHDQTEAMTLGDRVTVMRDGLLQQVGPPEDLYERPVNLFVAEFIGSPAMNLVVADIVRGEGGLRAAFGDNSIPVDNIPGLAGHEGRQLILGIRPEDLEDAALGGKAGAPTISATTDIRENLGSEVLIHFGVAGQPVRGEDVKAAVGEEAIEATSAQARRQGSLFTARISRESAAREGERVELAVDTKRLHFFDPDTGEAITR